MPEQPLNLKQCPQCKSYSRSELYLGRFTPDNPCPHIFHRPLKNVPDEIFEHEARIRSGDYIDRQKRGTAA
jgi:hypothetical protein